jgi:peptidoglycan/xylan/chitin deacetylase (PgdA/CDA1 family)
MKELVIDGRASLKRAWGTASKLPILMYHNVGPQPLEDPHCLTVAPAEFDGQMRYLVNHGYQTIWPSDWLSARREGKPLPERPIVLTFDDGYADLVEHAFPVLRRHGLKAAVYIVTRRLGLTNTWDEGVEGYRVMPLMSSDQIRRWADQGIEFGSHTRTHPHLNSLSEERFADEIEGSKDDLESLLGADVLSFAYPYGEGGENGVIRKHVSRVYQLAFSTSRGFDRIDTNPFQLRRFMILPGDTLLEFERKVCLKKTLANLVRERVPSSVRKAMRLGRLALSQWGARG